MRSNFVLARPTGSHPLSAAHPDCTKCGLSAACKTVCVRTHLRWGPGTPTETAVLIIGEAPGASEDALGIPFVGEAGEKLEAFYVGGGKLDEMADVYVGNVVRCRPPDNRDPNKAETDACLPYLKQDIAALSNQYVRVAVLCVGAAAVKTVGRYARLTDAFAHQGEKNPSYSANVTFFYTYHPAAMLPGRDPNLERPTMTHVMALNEWLVNGSIRLEDPPPVLEAPQYTGSVIGDMIGLDIETWGTLKNKQQYTFCPIKARYVQGIPYDDQIVTVAICYKPLIRGPAPATPYRTGVFVWANPEHRARLLAWLNMVRIIRGQHLQFDIKFLRAADPMFKLALTPAKIQLDDLMVRSFLLDDLAPERALDAVAMLYRVYQYGGLKAVEEFRDEHGRKRSRGIYTSAYDHDLWKYNCIDAWAAYLCITRAIGWTREKFGSETNAVHKTSAHTADWYSRKLWSAIIMEEAGLCVDLRRLNETHVSLTDKANRLAVEAMPEGIVLKGTGSLTCKQVVVEEANNYIVANGDQRMKDELNELERTKEGKLSTNGPNRNRLIGLLPLTDSRACKIARQLAIISESNSVNKLIDSYTYKLLFGRRDGTTHVTKIKMTKKGTTKLVRDKDAEVQLYNRNTAVIPVNATGREIGFAFPQIIILPRTADWTGQGGGVRQYRWSMKDPDAQTMPPLIRNCLTTRYKRGVLVAWDYSQIEWRTAMYIADDPVGLKEIADRVDIHTRSTEQLLLGLCCVGNFADPEFLKDWFDSPYVGGWLCVCPDVEMRERARAVYDNMTHRFLRRLNLTELGTFVGIALKWMRTMVGKSPNFLYLYGGYPRTAQRTVRMKAGVDLPFSLCTDWWNYLNNLYFKLTELRQRLLQEAEQKLAIHLPILGQSRSFAGDPGTIAEVNREAIFDMPIQAMAGNILQSAIDEAQEWIRNVGASACVVMNWHDAMLVDIDMSSPYRGEQVAKQMRSCMISNWYLREMEKHYNRKFPIGVEPKVLDSTLSPELLDAFKATLK